MTYQDEVHFQIQTTVTSAWYKKGSAPTIKSFPGRFKVSYSGFVIPESGVLFTTKPETFDYETTIESIRAFLTANPVPEGKKYAIVMDNAPWHKKTIRLIEKEAQPEYADIRSSVIFQTASLLAGFEFHRAGMACYKEGKHSQCILLVDICT